MNARETQTKGGAVLGRGLDVAICAALCVGYGAWLLSSVHDLGYARDEGFYFQAADSYLEWFLRFADNPGATIHQDVVDRYWRVNHEHPALVKSLFALGRHFLHDRWHWVSEPGTSYRAVGMAFSCLALCVTYLWGKLAYGRQAGLMAALLFAFVPRVFYHSHLDCFDMPVLSMWLVTSYAYARSVGTGPRDRRRGWAIAAGVLYGLLLNTKHNSWLLPFALVAHVLITEGANVLDGLRRFRLRAPLALWLMASIGPVLFYYLWPWIWFDTFARLSAYVRFHTAHVYYNMEFLGHTYFAPPFPRAYAWLMTVATVPFVTLLLAGIGVVLAGQHAWQQRLQPLVQHLRSSGWASVRGFLLARASQAEGRPRQLAWKQEVLWLLCAVASYAPWFSNQSPIFGGTKHWMTAYPFFALFAGGAFVRVAASLRTTMEASRMPRAVPWEGLAAAAVLVGPLTMTANAHPYALSAYTPLVGGAPGAATLGLNRSFWGYTTGAVQDEVNQLAGKRAKVFIHDTAMQSWSMLRKDGRVRKDLRPQLSPAWSQVAIYHHEQHMSRVEHQIWVEYGTVRPAHIGALDGVPVVWLYEKPKTPQAPRTPKTAPPPASPNP